MDASGNKPKRGRGRPTEWTEEKALQLGNDMLDWFKEDKSRVFMQEFIVEERGLYADLINDLSSKWPEFSRLVKRVKAIQEIRLAQCTLNKQNPAGAIFLLKNHHGYADKQEVKTENVNYNYDPADLRTKTTDELIELLNQETNTTH